MATITVDKADMDGLREFTRNTEWLLKNVGSLRTRFPDRYVAVFDSGKQLLDAQTLEELTKKLLERDISPETCAIEFVTREPYLLIV